MQKMKSNAITELVIVTRYRYSDNTTGLCSNYRCCVTAATIYVPPWENHSYLTFVTAKIPVVYEIMKDAILFCHIMCRITHNLF